MDWYGFYMITAFVMKFLSLFGFIIWWLKTSDKLSNILVESNDIKYLIFHIKTGFKYIISF